MEAELITAVATSLAGAMTTSAWQTVRDRVAGFFGRDREEVVTAELETVREEYEQYGDAASLTEWLRRAVAEHPGFADELRAVLAEHGGEVQVRVHHGTENVISGGTFHGKVIQAHNIGVIKG
ncbi:hypothetical protein ACIRBX_17150 [Kitasatospora sp. NPDC096147]|uniref:hypothetical protein n=1 Tax=Kitasatospora sp. NPDC096147 TaxID=3364093 RepID=UPI0037F10B30